MATVPKNGKMEPCMKDSGNLTKQMDKENSGTWMEIFLKVNGLMIKRMGTGYILIRMVRNIKDFGKMIFNMGKEKKHGWMALSTKANTKKEESMDGANISGKTNPSTKETGWTTE